MHGKMDYIEVSDATEEESFSLKSIIDIKKEIVEISDSECQENEDMDNKTELENTGLPSIVISEVYSNCEKLINDNKSMMFINKINEKGRSDCKICFQNFDSSAMENHITNDHQINYKLYLQTSSLLQHLIIKKIHSDTPEEEKDFPKVTTKNDPDTTKRKNFKCVVCDWSANSFEEIKEHLRKTHKNQITDKFKEENKKKLNGLKRKMEMKDEGASGPSKMFRKDNGVDQADDLDMSEKIVCVVCGKVFDNEVARISHYTNDHGATLMFKCTVCKVKYKELALLKRHYRSKHLIRNDEEYELEEQGSQKKIDCIKCDGFFVHKDLFEKHKKKNPVEYSCLFCCMKYRALLHMEKHYERAHRKMDQKLKCKICELKFHNKFLLNEHIKKMHGITCPRISIDNDDDYL